MRHLRYLTVLLIMLFAGTTANAQTCTIFATTAGGGAGTSFADATTLSSALPGTAGDVICVATGTYSPGSTTGATFTIGGGVTVVGGFAGTESGSVTAASRVLNYHAINPTILDGDWDNDSTEPFGDATANYHVVTIASAGVVLDGVIVQGGNDDRAPTLTTPDGVGGGILVNGGTGSPLLTPTIRNSVLRGNSSAAEGASIGAVNAGYNLLNVLITESGGAPSSADVVAAAGARSNFLATAGTGPYPVSARNVTIAGNGGQAFVDAQAGESVVLTMENSIMYNNALDLPANSATFQETEATLTNLVFEQASDFCGVGGVAGGCTDVSDVDPNLRQTDGFQSLQASSTSAIDQGNNGLYALSTFDGRNDARLQNGGSSLTVDLGWVEGTNDVAPAAPDVAFDTASPLDLGTAQDTDPALPQETVNVQNIGDAGTTLEVTDFQVVADAGYTIGAGNLGTATAGAPVSIAAGSSEPFTIDFTPVAGDVGVKTATITVVSNDPDTPNAVFEATVEVLGANIGADGVNPAVAVTMTPGSISRTGTATGSVTISNIGDSGTSLDITGAATFTTNDGGEYEVTAQPASFPVTLTGGTADEVIYDVAFNTDNSDVGVDGTFTGVLSIPNDDPNDNPFEVTFTVEVISAPLITGTVQPVASTLSYTGDPAVDVNDVFALSIRIGDNTPVSDLMGLSFELKFDETIVSLIDVTEGDAYDNDPGINQDAEDQLEASLPVVGTYDLQNVQGGELAAAGQGLLVGGAGTVAFGSELAPGHYGLSASRLEPATGVNGAFEAMVIFFRVSPNVCGFDAGEAFGSSTCPVLSSFEILNAKATQVSNPGDPATFYEVKGEAVTGPFQVVDQVEVFPGDLNDDGVVTIAGGASDVFTLGECFGAGDVDAVTPGGPFALFFQRQGTDFLNLEFEANDAQVTGFAEAPATCSSATPDPVFADADGNGKVDEVELLPIGANFEDSQADFQVTKGGPAARIANVMVNPSDFDSDGKLALEVSLTAQIDDLYGFAAALNVPTDVVSIKTRGGSLIDDGKLLRADYYGVESGNYEVAVSRRAPAATVSGQGAALYVELELNGGAPSEPFAVNLTRAFARPIGQPAIEMTGETVTISTTSLSVATEDLDAVPTEFSLEQNYPNPFNPSTTITYQLAESSPVRLAVYDMLGRQVALLVSEGSKAAGSYKVNFDASGLASGLYLYRLETKSLTSTRTMQLIK